MRRVVHRASAPRSVVPNRGHVRNTSGPDAEGEGRSPSDSEGVGVHGTPPRRALRHHPGGTHVPARSHRSGSGRRGSHTIVDPTIGSVADLPVSASPCSPSLALAGTSTTVRRRADRGLVSAEWAMAIIAAVAIVGVLVAILTHGPVKAALQTVIVGIIRSALKSI